MPGGTRAGPRRQKQKEEETMTELDRIIAEQKLAVANIAREPDNRGARLGLADWVAEEVLLIAECFTPEPKNVVI